jgi:uncharacterized DUF497 family protein
MDMYVQMYIQWSCELSPASCEWDPVKARENFAKHAVRFGEATAVLEDDLALTMRDSFSEDEERWITLGRNEAGRILVVVFAWRGDNVRLISARSATPREKNQYEEHHEAGIRFQQGSAWGRHFRAEGKDADYDSD